MIVDKLNIAYGVFWCLIVFFLLSHFLLRIDVPSKDHEKKRADESQDSLKLEEPVIPPDSCSNLLSTLSFDIEGIDEQDMTFRLCSLDLSQSSLDRAMVGFLPLAFSSKGRYDYLSLIKNDRNRLENITRQYIRFIQDNQLDRFEAFEFVVRSIQQQPYALVHPESCRELIRQHELLGLTRTFRYRYHKEADYTADKCVPEIEQFGVRSPFEFMTNFKGDCDTRTVTAYAILDRIGLDVMVLNSDVKGHSILAISGLPMPPGSQRYDHNGKTYILCEMTQEVPIGFYNNNYNANEWYPVLT